LENSVSDIRLRRNIFMPRGTLPLGKVAPAAQPRKRMIQ
jgi:hypothetical protein